VTEIQGLYFKSSVWNTICYQYRDVSIKLDDDRSGQLNKENMADSAGFWVKKSEGEDSNTCKKISITVSATDNKGQKVQSQQDVQIFPGNLVRSYVQAYSLTVNGSIIGFNDDLTMYINFGENFAKNTAISGFTPVSITTKEGEKSAKISDGKIVFPDTYNTSICGSRPTPAYNILYKRDDVTFDKAGSDYGKIVRFSRPIMTSEIQLEISEGEDYLTTKKYHKFSVKKLHECECELSPSARVYYVLENGTNPQMAELNAEKENTMYKNEDYRVYVTAFCTAKNGSSLDGTYMFAQGATVSFSVKFFNFEDISFQKNAAGFVLEFNEFCHK
jgi:hypothetical protein